MRSTSVKLPPLPAIADERLEVHDVAHRSLADELAAADETTGALFRYVHQRLLNEAVATVAPVNPVGRVAALVPPRRRFLAPSFARRLVSCWDALRHIDERLAMRRRMLDRPLIGPETPYVLNALADRRVDFVRAGEVGQVRTERVDFEPGPHTWENPPAELCREMLADGIAVANEAPLPAIVRAGWLATVMFAVHPFVDGNGRVTRLLHQLVVSDALPERFDWGSIESWAADRLSYVGAIQRTWLGTGYTDGSLVAEPLVEFSIHRSVAGAARCRDRLEFFADMVDEHRRVLDESDVLAYLAVCADGNAPLDELRRLPLPVTQLRESLRRLWELGWLSYDAVFGWNPVGDNPVRVPVIAYR